MGSRRRLLAVALAASLITIPSSAGAAPGRHKLRAFASCASFVHYARRHAPNELRTRGIPEPVGLPVERTHQPMTDNGVAAPQSTAGGGAGQDFSTTNVQEQGVDEPDQVKTDGKTLFVVENQTLYAVDVRSDTPKLLGSLQLDSYGAQLLLDGNQLLVMAGSPIMYAVGGPLPPKPGGAPTPAARSALVPILPSQQSTLQLVDVSDPKAMKIEKTMSVGGGYLTARMTGDTARVVFSATPRVLPMLQGVAAPNAPRPQIAHTTTPDWRPSYGLRRGRRGKIARHALVRCTSISQPDTFSGLNSLTVLTIDLKKGLDPVDSDAVMTDGETVYASKDALYVATQKAIVEQPSSAQPPPLQTEIHKFDISKPDETTYEGSGVVPGTILNQYAMSEQDGYLRVATTDAPLWWHGGQDTQSESFVTVLKQDGGALTQVGQVGGLGKGERIYAVRFIGDAAYVVTFRQIDPLYTVGLSDPTHPKVLGSVELQGYSAYLHPVGDGLLLGVGQFVGSADQTEPSGLQVSLFDVSDPANPKRLSNALVGNGSTSSAQFDPHAFLWWDPLKLAVLPVQWYDQNSFSGAIGFSATKQDGVKEVGRLSQPDPSGSGYSPAIDRTLVTGDRLFSVSYAGVMASDLGTFAQRGFVAFPQPQNSVGVVTAPPAR